MELRISFDGGHFHGQSALTDGLDEIKVIFVVGERRVQAYRRFNETIYAYSQDLSDKLTAKYDATRSHFALKEPSSLRFEDEAGPIEPIDFSDKPITDDAANQDTD